MQKNKHLDWVKDSVFYQIFPDRFAKSEKILKPTNIEPWYSRPTESGFKGGDLLGVCENLDYLEDLGVNAIYLNPIFQSTMNHRYGVGDYYNIDPLLGGNQAFRIFLDTAKKRRFRVIIDGVFNHTGRSFYQFQNIVENMGDSPYLDWFYIKWFPVNAYDFGAELNYRAFYDKRGLPKLNLDNPSVREFIYNVAEFWTRFGIDGWRLDAPTEIESQGFWEGFRKRVKTIRHDAYLVGETWDDGTHWIKGDIFDGTTNYPLLRACLGFFCKGKLNPDLIGIIGNVRELNAHEFRQEISRIVELYQNSNQLQFNFLSNHDIARYLSMCNGDISSLKLSILFQMAFLGVPVVYYGDEIGMEGKLEPDCRCAFPWETNNWNLDILDYYKSVINLRRKYQALKKGEFSNIRAENDIFAFLRIYQGEKVLVIMNASNGVNNLAIDWDDLLVYDIKPETSLMPVFGEAIDITNEQHKVTLSLQPRSGLVLSVI